MRTPLSLVALTSVRPNITTQVSSNSLTFNWYGAAGVSYEAMCSSNLVDWVPCNALFLGTNGPLQMAIRTGPGPMLFFRVMATY